MAQYGDQYGHTQNQDYDIKQVHDNSELSAMNGANVGNYPHQQQQQHDQQEKLHRTSSSSSSEDEGQGDIRKRKGLTEKIMDKIPGVGHKQQQPDDTAATNAATTMPGGEGGHGEEKKGVVDKIKEKLPGVN